MSKKTISEAEEKLKKDAYSDLLNRINEFEKETGTEIKHIDVMITNTTLHEDEEKTYELTAFKLGRTAGMGESEL
jgi:hypothetical protein